MSPYRSTKKADRDADDKDLQAEPSGDNEDDTEQAEVDMDEIDADGVDEEGENVVEGAIADVALLPLLDSETAEAKSAMSKVSCESPTHFIYLT